MPESSFNSRSEPVSSSNASCLSLDSVTSVSTNQTASDLPGPGRTVGKFYDYAGKALEKRLNRFVGKRRQRRNGQGPSTRNASVENNNAVTLFHTASDDNDDDDVASGSESAARSRRNSETSSMHLSAHYSSLSISTNETASNIAGPGRLLGNLYQRGGRSLESKLNRMATLAGLGPDACSDRIKTELRKGWRLDSQRLHASAFRDVREILALTAGSKTLDVECKKLLQYARSSVPGTRQRALQHITNLSIEDSFVQSIFNAFGADALFQDLKAREKRYRVTDSDAFIPYLRKAIVAISKNEVNDIVRKSEREDVMVKSEDEHEGRSTDMFHQLSPYLKDTTMSFLALRHIRRTIRMGSRPGGPDFIFSTWSDMVFQIADLIYSLPSIVEWDCVDDIFVGAIQSYQGYVYHGAVRLPETKLKWNAMVVTVLRYAHLLPQSLTYVVAGTDVNSLLDSHNANPAISEYDFIAFPDEKNLDPVAFAAAAFYPLLLLDLHSDSSVPSMSSDICRYDMRDHLRLRYVQSELKPLWKNLSVGPNVIAAEILAERLSSTNLTQGMHRVPRPHVLQSLCKRLVQFLVGTDSDSRSLAMKRIKLIMQLDRYCKNAIVDALVSIATSLGGRLEGNTALMANVTAGRVNLDFALGENDFFRWLFRHRSTDGGNIHIRKFPPYSQSHPCALCQHKGIWENWLDSDSTGSQVLTASTRQLMLLEVEPGSVFLAAGHRPVLVGINDECVPEYLASVLVPPKLDPGVPDLEGHLATVMTTVTDGASQVEYIDYLNNVWQTDHFWVVVLRYDTSEDTEDKMKEMGGLDVTGQCYWK